MKLTPTIQKDIVLRLKYYVITPILNSKAPLSCGRKNCLIWCTIVHVLEIMMREGDSLYEDRQTFFRTMLGCALIQHSIHALEHDQLKLDIMDNFHSWCVQFKNRKRLYDIIKNRELCQPHFVMDVMKITDYNCLFVCPFQVHTEERHISEDEHVEYLNKVMTKRLLTFDMFF